MKKHFSLVLVILIAGIIVTAMITSGCKNNDEKLLEELENIAAEETMTKPLVLQTRGLTQINPDQIWSEIENTDNILARQDLWQQKFFATRVQWSAAFSLISISEDYLIGVFDWPYLNGKLPGGGYTSWYTTYVIFKESERDSLSVLHEGDIVQFEGTLIYCSDTNSSSSVWDSTFEDLDLPLMVKHAVKDGHFSLYDGVIIQVTQPPEKIVEAFLQALTDARYSDAVEYLTTNSRAEYLTYLNENFGKEFNSLEEALMEIPAIDRFAITDIAYDNETDTTVSCDIYTQGDKEEAEFAVILENGSFKLVLP